MTGKRSEQQYKRDTNKEKAEHSARLNKTRNKILAVCTEVELADFIYFIRSDTVRQLVNKTPKERNKLFDTFITTH